MARVSRKETRQHRHLRIRVKVHGTAGQPRLCVFRSNKHVYAQLVDDEAGKTLCGVSTLTPTIAERMAGKKGLEKAKVIGEVIGEMATSRNISRVVFDRGGYAYGGQVKAVADGARAKGLKF